MNLKNTIISVLKRDGEARIEVLKASLKLESGFGDKVIDEIFKNMKIIGLIVEKDGILTLTEKGKSLGAEQ